MPVLYEFEACPWCRIAREAISEAGVSVLVRPCPKGGTIFRPVAQELGGKAQFPFLFDPQADAGLYESKAIAEMMSEKYKGRRPLVHRFGPLNGVLSQYTYLLRAFWGRDAKASARPAQPLELYASEASPSGRLVREELSIREIEYVWHPTSDKGLQLTDPSRDMQIRGTRAILSHIRIAYKAS